MNKVNHLKDHLGYHLRLISNEVSFSFARRLDEFDVTVAEWVILREMYSRNNTTSPSLVAEMTGLTRGAVSKLIDRLINKNLVHRAESADDRRYQEIKLTSKAIKLVPSLAKAADENDEFFFDVLSNAEKKSLIKILEKLQEHHKIKTNPIK